MKVICKRHKEIMAERYHEGKILPYCLSCFAEHEFPKALREYHLSLAYERRTAPQLKKFLYSFLQFIARLISYIITLAFATAILGFMLGLLVSFFLGMPKGLTIGFVTVGIGGLIVFFVQEAKQQLSVPDEKQKPTIELLRREMESKAELHQKTTDAFKERLKESFIIFASKIDVIDSFSGTEFEEYLAEIFRSMGYAVATTPASGDDGVDLILYSQGSRIAVQCKRYSGNVGVSAIQEVYAGKTVYDCSEAWVITNAYFTSPAQKTAAKLGVFLWDRNILIQKISELQLDGTWDDYLLKHFDLERVNELFNLDLQPIINSTLKQRKRYYM